MKLKLDVDPDLVALMAADKKGMAAMIPATGMKI